MTLTESFVPGWHIYGHWLSSVPIIPTGVAQTSPCLRGPRYRQLKPKQRHYLLEGFSDLLASGRNTNIKLWGSHSCLRLLPLLRCNMAVSRRPDMLAVMVLSRLLASACTYCRDFSCSTMTGYLDSRRQCCWWQSACKEVCAFCTR